MASVHPCSKASPSRKDIIQEVRADNVIKKSKSATGWCRGNISFCEPGEGRDLWGAIPCTESHFKWGLFRSGTDGGNWTEAIYFVLYQLQLLCGDYTQHRRVRFSKLKTLNLSLIAHQHLPPPLLSPDVSPPVFLLPFACFSVKYIYGGVFCYIPLMSG